MALGVAICEYAGEYRTFSVGDEYHADALPFHCRCPVRCTGPLQLTPHGTQLPRVRLGLRCKRHLVLLLLLGRCLGAACFQIFQGRHVGLRLCSRPCQCFLLGGELLQPLQLRLPLLEKAPYLLLLLQDAWNF